MSTNTILSQDKLYMAHDRIVCGRITCAGSTAAHTGFTIGGAKVQPYTEADAAEDRAAGILEPTCECGAVTATPDSVTTGPLAGTIAWIAHPSDPEATWLAYFDGQRWMGTFYLDGRDNYVTNKDVRIIGTVVP